MTNVITFTKPYKRTEKRETKMEWWMLIVGAFSAGWLAGGLTHHLFDPARRIRKREAKQMLQRIGK